MAAKQSKAEYSEFDKEVDIEWFRDSILTFFSEVSDPRSVRKSTYKLEHIFFIMLSAVLAGANSINQIAVFSKAKAGWIKSLIDIEITPTYGVFWWILVRTKPEYLRQLLGSWLAGLPDELRNQVLAIDGKRLNGTQSDLTDNPFLHLVSIFVVESGVVVAHQPVKTKSNEITAIPELLEGLEIRGAIVTIDAMGCQKSIAQKISNAGADYVLALKGNAGHIYSDVKEYFQEAKEVGHEYLEHTFSIQKENGHGREVFRTVRCVQDVEWLAQIDDWKNLTTLIEIVSERIENGKKSIEHRYYISSLDTHADKLARVIQSHWGIENHLHRQLDINFAEDDSPVNTGFAAENLAVFRRLALNILGSGKGLLERRKRAGWDESYLTEIVSKFFLSRKSN